MRALAACFALAACATSSPAPGELSAAVRVETVTLDLLPEGKGSVGFLLDVQAKPNETRTVTRVEWQLKVQGREFAAGVASANVMVPGGDHARVKIEEPVAFGGMAYDGRARTLPVALRGELVTDGVGGEERLRFAMQTRVAVRGAPVYDRQ